MTSTKTFDKFLTNLQLSIRYQRRFWTNAWCDQAVRRFLIASFKETCEKTWHWHHRQISIKPGTVIGPLMPRCPPAEGLRNVCRSSAVASVRFSIGPFDWTCCLASDVGHPTGKHYRPWYSTSASLVILDLLFTFDTVDHNISVSESASDIFDMTMGHSACVWSYLL